MSFLLGFRNSLRNARRTFLTALGVAGALGLLVVVQGILDGEINEIVRGIVRSGVGHVVVRPAGFLEDPSRLIEDTAIVSKALRQLRGLRAHSWRLEFGAILSSDTISVAALCVGVDPKLEAKFSGLKDAVVSGSWLEDGREALLGQALAESLGVGVGDTVALITGSRRGILTGELLVVKGLFRSGSRMDKEVAYLPLAVAQEILETRGVSAAPVLLARAEDAPKVAESFREILGPGFDVKSIEEAMPVVKFLVEVAREEKLVLTVLIYAIAALGILNTALMSVMERTRELGLLYALGMSRARVAAAFLWEMFFVYLYGAVPGMGLGALVVLVLTKTGIPIPGLAELSQEYNLFLGRGIYPELRLESLLWVLGISLTITLFAAVPPLLRALRVQPAEAMRR